MIRVCYFFDVVTLLVGDVLRRAVGFIFPRKLVILHHLACSGGTIMTKCLASMPEVLVLSEIHPDRAAQPAFHPLGQVRRGYGALLNPIHREMIRGHFRREIVIAHATASSLGRKLVLRDHSHVDFAWRGAKKSALLAALSSQFRITSIVTVRDPREVWLSLRREGWFDGTPDELCQAQLALLNAFPNAAIFKYEDFLTNPTKVTRQMCAIAGVKFVDNFESRLSSISHLTGDSGRKGDVIEAREPKLLTEEDQQAFESSEAFRQLVEKIGLKI